MQDIVEYEKNLAIYSQKEYNISIKDERSYKHSLNVKQEAMPC
jgi:hypothetical protein